MTIIMVLRVIMISITLLSFDLQRNYYIKNVVLFEENSILLLPGRLEASGVESVWGEVSQESPKKSVNIGKNRPSKGPIEGLEVITTAG